MTTAATASPKGKKSAHRIGGEVRSQTRAIGEPELSRRPLLVIDGDSFAHRSYHALPKNIRRSDGKGAGAIVGFANFLLRFYADEQPRAVIVGWDTLDAPTKRHEMFPAYQAGREFDEELIEQLNVLPELVDAFGFANAKAPGYEADDFLAAAVAAEKRAGGTAVVASGDRDSFQLASPSTTILYPSRGGELAASGPKRFGNGMASIRSKCRTLSLSVAILPTNCRAPRGSSQSAQRNWFEGMDRSMLSLRLVSFAPRLKCSASIG
jgi:5'-3' exonuclease, N-terminal resolvase-like domain